MGVFVYLIGFESYKTYVIGLKIWNNETYMKTCEITYAEVLLLCKGAGSMSET